VPGVLILFITSLAIAIGAASDACFSCTSFCASRLSIVLPSSPAFRPPAAQRLGELGPLAATQGRLERDVLNGNSGPFEIFFGAMAQVFGLAFPGSCAGEIADASDEKAPASNFRVAARSADLQGLVAESNCLVGSDSRVEGACSNNSFLPLERLASVKASYKSPVAVRASYLRLSPST
jgi:hypothetical protein